MRDLQLFQATTAWPFFHEFSERLESLEGFLLMTRVAVETAIDEMPRERDRQIEELQRLESEGSDEVFVDAATYDYWAERLAVAPDHYREFLYTGITAALFANLEAMLDEMVRAAADETGVPVELDPRPLPNIDKKLLFLERTCGLVIALPKEQRKRLADIREMRNRLVHSFGADLSDELKQRLNDLLSPDDAEPFVVDHRLVEHALAVVSDVAEILEAAFDKRFSGIA
jgi:hypothetical protein